MNTTAKILGGFLAGAAVGAVAGLLLAPESGEKTRKKMMDESKRLSDQLGESVSKTIDSVKTAYSKTMDDLVKSGKTSVENAKQTTRESVKTNA